MPASSRTLILVKPDAFERGLTGEVLARFERKGLRLVALRQLTIDDEFAGRHYEEHTDKPFFGELSSSSPADLSSRRCSRAWTRLRPPGS